MPDFNKEKIRLTILVFVLIVGFFVMRSTHIFQPAGLLLSPNSGESFVSGQKITFQWTLGSPGIRLIELVPTPGGSAITIYQPAPFGYSMGDPGGYYLFDPIASPWIHVPTGFYHVRMYSVGSTNYTQSSLPIRIEALKTVQPVVTPLAMPLSTQPPSVYATPVKVISPNGGETFTVDGSMRISWSGGKNKVWVGIAKGDYQPERGDSHLGWITKNAVPNSFVFWDGKTCVIPGDCRPVTYWQPSGSVKIFVVSENNDGDICISADRSCNLDVSDLPFTIKSRSPLPLPSSTRIAPTPRPEKTPLSPVLPKTKSSSSRGSTPLLAVTSPNGGEAFIIGSTIHITWSSEHTPEDMLINMYLFTKDPKEGKEYVWVANVASYAKNTGTINWTIPRDIKPNNNYFLRIGCQYAEGAPYEGCITDDSDNAFSVNDNAAPAGGEMEQILPIEEKAVPSSVMSEKPRGFFKGLWGGIKSVFGF